MLDRQRILDLAANDDDVPPVSAEQAEQVIRLMTEFPARQCEALKTG